MEVYSGLNSTVICLFCYNFLNQYLFERTCWPLLLQKTFYMVSVLAEQSLYSNKVSKHSQNV